MQTSLPLSLFATLLLAIALRPDGARGFEVNTPGIANRFGGTLDAAGGSDRSTEGAARERCLGGAGTDAAALCEVVIAVP